jgi:putative acetyltransferase
MVTGIPSDAVGAAAWAIRPEEPIDIDLIHDLHRAAFPGPAEAELVDAIRSGPDFLPELSLVAATVDGSILGHVLISRIRLERDDREPPRLDILALAPLAVLPAHQGRGIGAALMRAALRAADDRDEPMTVVVGAPAFYSRFGFWPVSDAGIHGPYDDAGDAFQVRPRPGVTEDEFPTGTVVYPQAFSSV